MNRISTGSLIAQRYRTCPAQAPRIAVLTGGTGSRYLAMDLRTYTYNTSYIIGTADSGGSTRQLRLMFDMPAIGDFRSRLIDLADRTAPGYKEVSALLKHRFPKTLEQAELELRLHQLINGQHPLIQAIIENNDSPTANAKIVMQALQEFQNHRLTAERRTGATFNLRGASIGNLFLTGLYLYYGRDFEVPIHLYKYLAGVKGDVIPATLDNVHIAALMADGGKIFGQHNITPTNKGPVEEMWYTDNETPNSNSIEPSVNPSAVNAIQQANLIVFGMGSFFSSILSILMIPGISQAIRQNHSPKIFIANSTEDEETVGMSAGQMARILIETMQKTDPEPGCPKDYVSHILTNQWEGASPIIQSKYGHSFSFLSTDTTGIDPSIERITAFLTNNELLAKYRHGIITAEEHPLLSSYQLAPLINILFSFFQ